MDPRLPPITVTITGTSAQLLARLAVELGSDDSGAVLMRALGLLDLALGAKRSGRRLGVVDPRTGEISDVAF